MHFITATTTLLLTTALTATASPTASPAGTFHITNFHTITSDIYPNPPTLTTFNVTLNNRFTAHCSVKNTDKSYVFCGAAPEQAYYAYIPTSSDGKTRVLDLEFEVSLPGSTTRTYGTKVLRHPSASFDVPAYAATTAA